MVAWLSAAVRKAFTKRKQERDVQSEVSRLEEVVKGVVACADLKSSFTVFEQAAVSFTEVSTKTQVMSSTQKIAYAEPLNSFERHILKLVEAVVWPVVQKVLSESKTMTGVMAEALIICYLNRLGVCRILTICFVCSLSQVFVRGERNTSAQHRH